MRLTITISSIDGMILSELHVSLPVTVPKGLERDCQASICNAIRSNLEDQGLNVHDTSLDFASYQARYDINPMEA